ncbi:autotransporter outer membrane beta-barrel domain-containing protein, partial [Gallibacterium sp. AGMB14963]|uniref:autotransporter outer membrane beta-barrel domain-containing protein n=1 Tax=Gallibacterium faecale TaxID=3019086 RepID=UPI0022F1A453
LYMDNLNLLSAQRTLWQNLNIENNLWVDYQQQKLRTNIQSLSSESQTNRILLGRSTPVLNGSFGVQISLGQTSWKDKLNNTQHTTHHQTTSISMGYRYTGLGVDWLTSVGYGYISGKVQTDQKDTFTAHQYTAGIAVSRQFRWDDLQVTPTAGLQYISAHSGGSASARILALNASQLTLHLGLATEYMLRDNLKAYLKVGFERDIKQVNKQTVSDLTIEYQSDVAMPTNHFTVKLGTDWNITERWKIGASYEYSTSQQWRSHNLNLSTSYYY